MVRWWSDIILSRQDKPSRLSELAVLCNQTYDRAKWGKNGEGRIVREEKWQDNTNNFVSQQHNNCWPRCSRVKSWRKSTALYIGRSCLITNTAVELGGVGRKRPGGNEQPAHFQLNSIKLPHVTSVQPPITCYFYPVVSVLHFPCQWSLHLSGNFLFRLQNKLHATFYGHIEKRSDCIALL